MPDAWIDDLNEEDSFAFSLSTIELCINAQTRWSAQADVGSTYAKLNEIKDLALAEQGKHKDQHDALDALIDAFYSDWGFSGTHQQVKETQLNSVLFAVQYRTGNSLSLAIVLIDVLQHCGYNAHAVIIDEAITVRVSISEQEHYLIDPVSGLQQWHLEAENEEHPMAFEMLDDEELYKLFLAHQKWAFIAASQFGGALACVDLLIELLGDDPYERRDRGYLLQQINRPELAKEDLEFFVEECPDDPANELIRHQIDELENQNNTLH